MLNRTISDIFRDMNQIKIKNLLLGLIILFFIGCEGEEGPIGPNGENGTNGTNGFNSLVSITNEPSGTNCENGGIKVEVGIDNNSNGSLDSDEILSTSYVCNGIDGNTSLTSVITEPAGTNCENGGIKIDSGVDTNKDGTLDDTEITATAFVCNGIDGNNSLTKITSEAAGTNCKNGGLKIDSGIDSNSDGTLDDSEITATAYVCNGIDGNDGLIKTTNEPVGTNCENGGLKIDSGVDSNSDGILDDSEITATAYICNGIDGNNSLTKITSEAAGTNCENGGLKIDTGVDGDSNGTLDDSEITATTYACNGLDGNVSLVNITDEVAGSNCENGGVQIESGVDTDGDGTLGIEEVLVTRYICNGVDGGFDEQIRLTILIEGGSGTLSTEGYIIGELLKFNKNSWIGVDSIVFVAKLYTSDATHKAYAQLYDLTNETVIPNSEVSTNSEEAVNLFSENIFEALPDGEVNLGMLLRTENNSTFAWRSGSAFLLLYRSN